MLDSIWTQFLYKIGLEDGINTAEIVDEAITTVRDPGVFLLPDGTLTALIVLSFVVLPALIITAKIQRKREMKKAREEKSLT